MTNNFLVYFSLKERLYPLIFSENGLQTLFFLIEQVVLRLQQLVRGNKQLFRCGFMCNYCSVLHPIIAHETTALGPVFCVVNAAERTRRSINGVCRKI